MVIAEVRIPPSLVTTSSDALLISKLQPPRQRMQRLARPRLLELLDKSATDATIVVAPAGYGKTTLMAQWASTSSNSVAWLSLEPSDDDPARFVNYLAAAIQRGEPAFLGQVDPGIAASQTPADVVLAPMINSLHDLSRPLTIVLDDFHVIGHERIHDMVRALIEHDPDHVRIVIGSRHDPPIALAKLRLHGRVTTVGHDDLRFTFGETRDLYHSLGIDLGDAKLAVVQERTTGWAAGLQMAAINIAEDRGSDPSDALNFDVATRWMQDYMLEEILRQQPAEIQDLLLRTALFDRFTADLYRSVSGVSNAPRLLERVLRSHLFISTLDERDEWCGYHQIFREFLRKYAEQWLSQDDRAEIYRAASVWFAERGLLDQAISSAISGRAWDLAANLIRPIAVSTVDSDKVMALLSWFQALPGEVVRVDPVLSATYAWAAVRSGEFHLVDQMVDFSMRAARSNDDAAGLAMTHAAQMIRARYEEDWEMHARRVTESRELLERAENQPKKQPASDAEYEFYNEILNTFRSGWFVQSAVLLRLQGRAREAEAAGLDALERARAADTPYQYAGALIELSVALLQQGRLRDAEARLGAAIAADVVYPSERRLAMLSLADAYRERGHFADAQRLLDDCRNQLEIAGLRTWLPQLHLAYGRLARSRGDFQAILDSAQAAVAATAGYACKQLERVAQAMAAQEYLRRGDLGLAERWANQSRFSVDDEPDYARLPEHLVFARLLIVQGDAEDAVALLERLLEAADEDGRSADALALLILLALAHQDLLRPDDAIAALDRAFRIGEREEYVRVFADEGSPMVRLLKVGQRRGISTSYCRRLLAALGEEGVEPVRVYHADLVEPLTAREIEVLRLIAEGLANKDIANEMFITTGTVKRHITNCYGKLGVSNRTDALRTARRLGLLGKAADLHASDDARSRRD